MNSILNCDGRAANNSQQAIALAAYSFVVKLRDFKTKDVTQEIVEPPSRLMIEMPPGTGKSVVIALLLGLITSKVKSTTILYNDADLLAFERETITRVCNDMSCQQINVKSLDEIMDKN